LKSDNSSQFDRNESLINKCLELADELLEINELKEESYKVSEEKVLLNEMFQEKLKKNLKVCSTLDKSYPITLDEKSLEDELKKTLKIYTDSGLEEKYQILKDKHFAKEMKKDFFIYSDSKTYKETPKFTKKEVSTKDLELRPKVIKTSTEYKEPPKKPKREVLTKDLKSRPMTIKTSTEYKEPPKVVKKQIKTSHSKIKSKISKKLPYDKKPSKKAKGKQKVILKTFFSEDIMQKIRFLHYKIKSIEEIMHHTNENFKISDLNFVHQYINFLNCNYKTYSQVKILRELDLEPIFYDPIQDRDIQIWDLMLECGRVLCILAKAYTQLSQKFESRNDFTNAITCMVECSKAFKTAAYFTAAQTRQEDIGTYLSAENLELKSEEARIVAQNLAIKKEDDNLYLSSQLYSGLAALLNRFQYLKSHEIVKQNQIKALINYYRGKACHLKAKAIIRSSSDKEKYNDFKVLNLQKKANFYFIESEEIWENILQNEHEISKKQKIQIKHYLASVNEDVMENDVEMIHSAEADKIPDPEPFVAIPENIAYCIPKFTDYLMNYPSTVIEKKTIRKVSLEQGSKSNELKSLINQKAGIGRTIKQLKTFYKNGDIDINKFTELFEKYSTKQKTIEERIEELNASKTK
jgi:hypothetical protein